jgi:hypothetical protein
LPLWRQRAERDLDLQRQAQLVRAPRQQLRIAHRDQLRRVRALGQLYNEVGSDARRLTRRQQQPG